MELQIPYLEIPSHLSAPNYKADLRQGVAVEYVSCEPTYSESALGTFAGFLVGTGMKLIVTVTMTYYILF